MALIKQYITPQGVSASYHKIVGVQLSSQQEVTTITVAVYASEDARDSNALPLWHEYVTIPFEATTVDPRVQFYELLQQYPDSYLNGSTPDANELSEEIPSA